jgi:hypothetical protein
MANDGFMRRMGKMVEPLGPETCDGKKENKEETK